MVGLIRAYYNQTTPLFRLKNTFIVVTPSNVMGNLRNLDLTKTVLNSIDSFIFCKKKRTFLFLQPVKVHSIFSLRQLGAGKTKMRFHFVQVERDSVGHSPP